MTDARIVRWPWALSGDESGLAKVVAAAPGHVRAVRDPVLGALTLSQVGQQRDISLRFVERVAARA